MLEMTRVPLSRIRPNENNPRAEFSGIEELAASFEFTPDRPGEPMNPIIVAKDGEVYRIIDGERRLRAMAKAGKVDSCLCVVSDSMEDADAVAMMLATDYKSQLSSDERAMGVQTMLMLGVDEEKAASLSKKAVDAERLGIVGRRLRRFGSKRPLQLDFSDLIAIADVETDDDAAELLGLAEGGTGWGSDFSNRRMEMLNRAKGRKRHEEFIEAFEELDVEWSYGKPEDYDAEDYRVARKLYYSDLESVKRSVNDGIDLCGDVFAVMPTLEEFMAASSSWAVCPHLMAKRDESEAEASSASKVRADAVSAVEDAILAYEKRIEDHVVSLMEEGRMRMMLEGDEACDAMATAVWSAFADSAAFCDACEILDGLYECREFPNYVTAYAVSEGLLEVSARALAEALVDDEMTDASFEAFSDLSQLYDMLSPTGYVRSNEEVCDFMRLEALAKAYSEVGE